MKFLNFSKLLHYFPTLTFGKKEAPKAESDVLTESQYEKMDGRHGTLHIYLTKCIPTDWREIFEYIDLSRKLKRPVDQNIIHVAVAWAELKELININAPTKISWNPIPISRAAVLMNAALESGVLVEEDVDMCRHQFDKVKELYGTYTGYKPLMELFLQEEKIPRRLSTLQQKIKHITLLTTPALIQARVYYKK